jgi:RNA polymerase sigma-70 factor, ECF subfamily
VETDEDLIRRFVATGDHAAFERLVLRHLGSIRRLLLTVLNGNLEDVADAEQEVLISLYRGLKSFAFRSSFRTWLYRFTRNRGIDYLRASRRRRRRDRALRGAPPSRVSSDPLESILRDERGRKILRSLALLGDTDRLVVTLREVEGLSMEEIGRTLGLPVGTVKSRLSRARARLLTILHGEEGDDASV